MAEGARLMNIPGFQANRGLVGFPDGGLHDPSILTFDPSYNTDTFSVADNKFLYPVLQNVKRPEKDDDIAFMTVSFTSTLSICKILLCSVDLCCICLFFP